MNRRGMPGYGFVMLVALPLLSACATTSKAQAVDPAKPPDWVLSPPKASAAHEFFVASATDASGDAARAEEQAVYGLIAEITRYMGVTISAETTSVARASLDRFQAEVTQQVKQTSAARVAGFRVVDRFVDKRPNRITVYILAQYERAELEKEKARLAAVFQERIDAVALPEARGKQLEGSGDLFGSFKAYVEAAVAASGSGIDNAEIKFERNINNAKAVLGRIRLVAVTPSLRGVVGRPFSEPFRARVVAGPEERPVVGADVIASFRELRSGGRTSIREAALQSDQTGTVEFQHPVPTFVGSETLTMILNVRPYLTALEKAPRQFSAMVGGLEDLAGSKRLRFAYTVESRAKEFALGVVILDVDKGGRPAAGSETGSGVVEALAADGFKVRPLPFDGKRLVDAADSEVLSALTGFRTQVDRVVFGTMTIDEAEVEAGSHIVRAAGTLKVADLLTGELLYTKRLSRRSRGSTLESAVRSAFRNLGVDFGEDLSRNLP